MQQNEIKNKNKKTHFFKRKIMFNTGCVSKYFHTISS